MRNEDDAVHSSFLSEKSSEVVANVYEERRTRETERRDFILDSVQHCRT